MSFRFNSYVFSRAILMAGCVLMVLHAGTALAHGDEEEAAAAAAGQLHKSRLVLEPGSLSSYIMSPAYAIYDRALSECYSEMQAVKMALPQDQAVQDLEGEPLPIGADGKRIFRSDVRVKECMDAKGVPYTYPEYMKDKPGKIDPTKIDPAMKADLDAITKMLEGGQVPAQAATSAAPSSVALPVTAGNAAAPDPAEGEKDASQGESDPPPTGEKGKRKSRVFYVTPE